MQKIIYYKAENGIYLASQSKNFLEQRNPLNIHKVNGKKLLPTFSKDWYFVEEESEPQKLEKYVKPTSRLIGFKLKDESLKSKKIPLKLSLEESQWCNRDEWIGSPYEDYSSLYEKEFENIEGYYEEVDFEVEYLGEIKIKHEKDIPKMEIQLYVDGQYPSKGSKTIDLSSIIKWEELETILVPPFALQHRPCFLESKQSYDIIRRYVKENIDLKQSEITSDYDFCFTVKKKVAIKPYIKKWEVKKANGKSYARPKMESCKVTHKLIPIFEMTSNIANCNGYTPIEGFRGDSLQDLAENIKLFLDELMYHINEPIEECSYCNGTGHVLPEQKHGQK